PAVAHLILRKAPRAPEAFPSRSSKWKAHLLRPAQVVDLALILFGLWLMVAWSLLGGALVVFVALAGLAARVLPHRWSSLPNLLVLTVVAVGAGVWLADDWLPLGADRGFFVNRLFVVVLLALVLGVLRGFIASYPFVLRWALHNKLLALSVPAALLL